MKTALKYSFGAIALYLGVAYATGSGVLLTDASSGAIGLVRAFQARD